MIAERTLAVMFCLIILATILRDAWLIRRRRLDSGSRCGGESESSGRRVDYIVVSGKSGERGSVTMRNITRKGGACCRVTVSEETGGSVFLSGVATSESVPERSARLNPHLPKE